MFSKALSHSDGLAPLPEPCFPEMAVAEATVTAARSRFSFTFLRFESKLGLCGVWPGEDDEEDEESLQLAVLVDEGAPTTDVPAPVLSGRVTSATARHTSIRAWKYVEKRLRSAESATAPPLPVAEMQEPPLTKPQLWVSWS